MTDVDRRTELLEHLVKLDASLEAATVECQDCAAVVAVPKKLSGAEVAAVLRERRVTLAELDGIPTDVEGTVAPEDQDLHDARDELAAFRDRKSGTDADPPAPERGKQRRKSGRNRGS